jgi:hypothetical protein
MQGAAVHVQHRVQHQTFNIPNSMRGYTINLELHGAIARSHLPVKLWMSQNASLKWAQVQAPRTSPVSLNSSVILRQIARLLVASIPSHSRD